MEIRVSKPSYRTKLKNVKKGEVYWYHGNLYLKIKPIQTQTFYWNTVDLKTGSALYLNEEKEVVVTTGYFQET